MAGHKLCVNALERALLISTIAVFAWSTLMRKCVNALERALLISTRNRLYKEMGRAYLCQCP